MKNIKLAILLFVGFLLLTSQEVLSQDQVTSINEKEFRIVSKSLIPAKVKNAVTKMRNYKIKSVAKSVQKSSNELYLVTLVKGKLSMRVLVNKEGKIVETLE